jgi:hypothetical protein
VVRGKPEQPQQWCIDVLDYATIAKSQGNAFGAVIEESLEVQDGTVMIKLATDGRSANNECELFTADSASAADLVLNACCF